MNTAEANQIQQAFARFGAKASIKKEDPKGEVWKLTLPFKDYQGEEFRIYAFQVPRGKKIFLSDGGALIKNVKGCGQPQMAAIQRMLETFELSLMEDLSVMDTSKRSLSVRVMSFLQAWCAVDGMIRIWKIAQEDVQSALRATG